MYISPMRDAIDAGLRPTNHTDFVVAPLDQMMMLWSAVNRISRAGAEIGPDQRVTAFEGLKAMTEWVAEQYDEQATKGTLEVGKLADLVILDKDPLKVDADGDQGHQGRGDDQGGQDHLPGCCRAEKPLHAAASAVGQKRILWHTEACDMAVVNQAAHKEWTLDDAQRQGSRCRKAADDEVRTRQARHFRWHQPPDRKLCPGRTTASPLVRWSARRWRGLIMPIGSDILSQEARRMT